ncbi:ATP-dependent 6-phosphofructokinase [Bienertia sinuspersici]
MGEDKSGKLKEKESRPVLGNITNQLGKRGFSLISSSPPSKSKSGNTNTGDDTDTDSSFWKQVSLVVEKLEKERSSSAKCPKIVNETGLSPLKGGKTYRLLNSSANSRKGLINVVHETKQSSSSALDSIDLDAANVGETVKEGGDSRVKLGESSKCIEKGEETREVSDNTHEVEVLGNQGMSDNARNVGVDCSTTSKSGLDVSSRLIKFAEMKGFGLERCTALKGDGGCSSGAGVDLLKQCSCSFCTKGMCKFVFLNFDDLEFEMSLTAYIWSDLHYQDVKGRISVLEKSEKGASDLAQKYNVGNEMGSHAQENVNDVEQLESDLMNKWRSLFHHMEDIFANEGSQLKDHFLALKDLREDFKMNVETITGMPVDVQQCSSDASDQSR